jgi:hypothetical protein
MGRRRASDTDTAFHTARESSRAIERNDWFVLRDKCRAVGSCLSIAAPPFISRISAYSLCAKLRFDHTLCVSAAVGRRRRREGAMFTLNCDHRVVFGADGGRFLTTLSEWLRDPGRLVG